MAIEYKTAVAMQMRDGTETVFLFDTRGEAEVFLWLLPLAQVQGAYTDVVSAIIRPGQLEAI